MRGRWHDRCPRLPSAARALMDPAPATRGPCCHGSGGSWAHFLLATPGLRASSPTPYSHSRNWEAGMLALGGNRLEFGKGLNPPWAWSWGV